MVLELCSENPSSRGISPRISFSHDLSQSDIVPVEQLLRSIPSSSVDFDFCTHDNNFDQFETSMADELFSDGKILPTPIKKEVSTTPPQMHHLPTPSLAPQPIGISEPVVERQNSKSFWGFKRSNSLNCGSGYARSLCPLPLLSRSNSTGSSSSPKRSSKDGINHKQQHSRAPFPQKPPLKKTVYGSYGNNNAGVRVNPVLNVPSANLFGLGLFFSSGKDKSKKKTMH